MKLEELFKDQTEVGQTETELTDATELTLDELAAEAREDYYAGRCTDF